MKILEIKTATNNNDEAKNIATALIKCHLIACAQIQKIDSRDRNITVPRWEDKRKFGYKMKSWHMSNKNLSIERKINKKY